MSVVTPGAPPERPAHVFTYTEADFFATYTPPPVEGLVEVPARHECDGDGRLTRVVLPDHSEVTYAYDAAGTLTQIVAPHGAYDFTEDAAGARTRSPARRLPRTARGTP